MKWGIKVHHLKRNKFFKIGAKDLNLFDMLEGLEVKNLFKLFGIVEEKKERSWFFQLLFIWNIINIYIYNENLKYCK